MSEKMYLTKEQKEFKNEKNEIIKYNQLYINYYNARVAIKAYTKKEKEILKLLCDSTLPYKFERVNKTFNDEKTNKVYSYFEYYVACGSVNARFKCLYKSDKALLIMMYDYNE